MFQKFTFGHFTCLKHPQDQAHIYQRSGDIPSAPKFTLRKLEYFSPSQSCKGERMAYGNLSSWLSSEMSKLWCVYWCF